MPRIAFQEALRRGLRSETYSRRNSQSLVDCQNLRVTDQGLRTRRTVIDPVEGSALSGQFPSGQFFDGQSQTIRCFNVGVQEITKIDGDDWDSSNLTLKKMEDEDQFYSFTDTTKNVWQFADFGETWFLTDSSVFIMRSNHNVIYGGEPVYLAQDVITVGAVAAHRGRLLMGGFDSSNFWTSTWAARWEAWLEDSQFTQMDVTGLAENYVWWSSIGGGDILGLFRPDIAQTGHLIEDGRDGNDPLYLDYIRRNEAGFMPLPRQGSVMGIHPMGLNVVVLASNHVALFPMSSTPFPTYGQGTLIHGVGLLSRGAFAGDERLLTFIDKAGEVWQVSQNDPPIRLGYSELFSGKTINVSYDSHYGEFYFTDGTDGWILTARGMSESDFPVQSVFNWDGSLHGVVLGSAATSYSAGPAVVTTEKWDAGTRALKRIVGVEVLGEINASATITLTIDYKDEIDDAFSSASTTDFDGRGFAFHPVAGVEFRISLSIDDVTGLELDNIRVYFSVDDVRQEVSLDVS